MDGLSETRVTITNLGYTGTIGPLQFPANPKPLTLLHLPLRPGHSNSSLKPYWLIDSKVFSMAASVVNGPNPSIHSHTSYSMYVASVPLCVFPCLSKVNFFPFGPTFPPSTHYTFSAIYSSTSLFPLVANFVDTPKNSQCSTLEPPFELCDPSLW